MANIQKQFDQFHDAIKLSRFGESAILREKRDIIRSKLEERLPGVFANHGEECPEYRFRNQGSYELGTGVKPLDGDYDIDQGLYFAVGTDTYPDPVVLKRRVHQALVGHTKDVRIRRPCVTVSYQRESEPIYHVDIAVHSDAAHSADGKTRLAKVRENSTQEHRVWEVSDPQGLTDAIYVRFVDSDRAQFRRVVRYLKRWRDVNFPKEGHAAPLGIGLTVAAYDGLTCRYSDQFAKTPDDAKALRELVGHILNRFVSVLRWSELKYVRRLCVPLPVEPCSDLFEQMSDKQMGTLEERLKDLRDALDAAAEDPDPVEACKALHRVFGDEHRSQVK